MKILHVFAVEKVNPVRVTVAADGSVEQLANDQASIVNVVYEEIESIAELIERLKTAIAEVEEVPVTSIIAKTEGTDRMIGVAQLVRRLHANLRVVVDVGDVATGRSEHATAEVRFTSASARAAEFGEFQLSLVGCWAAPPSPATQAGRDERTGRHH